MTGDPRRREVGGRERNVADDGPESPQWAAGRERLIDAFTKVASDRGYASTTVAEVASVADLPPAAFHAHFSNKRQCLSAAHEAFFDRLHEEAASAVDGDQEWPVRVKTAVFAVLEFVEETASRSRFFALEVLIAGPLILERHRAALDRVAPLLREGREYLPQAGNLPELTEVVLIGGAAVLLCSSLLAEERLPVSKLAQELVEMLLLPYVGREAARRIAA